jgi:hypothetical protein
MWDSHEEGVFSTTWQASEDGLHRVEVSATNNSDGTDLGSSYAYFLVTSQNAEFFSATQKKDFLENIARESGGRYYSIKNVDRLPEEILYTETQASTTQVLELWNMPINLLLLLILPLAEWVLRRQKGVI